jgi:hypothetical protein
MYLLSVHPQNPVLCFKSCHQMSLDVQTVLPVISCPVHDEAFTGTNCYALGGYFIVNCLWEAIYSPYAHMAVNCWLSESTSSHACQLIHTRTIRIVRWKVGSEK